MKKLKDNLYLNGSEVISYETVVAHIKGNKLIEHGKYSRTTSAHIRHVASLMNLSIVSSTERPEFEKFEGGVRCNPNFSTKTKWVSSDGWRGYSEPIYAVCGANNTGSYSDSPCPTNVCEQEIKDARAYLKKKGFKTRLQACESSNIFCQHIYVLAPVSQIEQAREAFNEYYQGAKDQTSLLYPVK